MKNASCFFSILVVTWVAFFFGCKKEDKTAPVVQISRPASGTNFNAGDTAFVEASISDETQLSSVSVRLVNSSYIAVGSDVSVAVSGNQLSINVQYVIENLNLPTGNYLFDVIASDGVNETNAYVTIHINELPRVRKGIFLMSGANRFSHHISNVDSFHIPHALINVSGDYKASAIHSFNHELFIIGDTIGDFNAFDLNTNLSLWSYPSLSVSIPTFRNLFFTDDLVYVSYFDGNIRAYDKNGSQKYAIQQTGNFIPNVVFKNNYYFFAEIYYPTLHQNKIGVFYLTSGVERQERNLDINLKNMYTLDAGHLLLFGNDTAAGQGKIELYNVTGNGTTLLHTIPSGTLFQVKQVNSSNYLISHSSGIYRYDYSLNSLTPFITGLPVYAMEYDDVNGEIFSASGNLVNVYNSTTGSLNYTITNPDSVMDVKIWYNK